VVDLSDRNRKYVKCSCNPLPHTKARTPRETSTLHESSAVPRAYVEGIFAWGARLFVEQRIATRSHVLELAPSGRDRELEYVKCSCNPLPHTKARTAHETSTSHESSVAPPCVCRRNFRLGCVPVCGEADFFTEAAAGDSSVYWLTLLHTRTEI